MGTHTLKTVGLCALAALFGVAGVARAQETWAPVIMFDGVNLTVNGTTTPIANPVSPVATIPYSFTPNNPIEDPNGFCENPITNEWIVADTYHARLLRFATDTNPNYTTGAYIGEIDLNGTAPYGPVVDDDGTIVVADYYNNAVTALVPSGGSYTQYDITTFLNNGQPDYFNYPVRVALTRGTNGVSLQNGYGALLVLDQYNNRVVELTPAGGLVNRNNWTVALNFGQDAVVYGAGPGHFYYPTGLAVDSRGNIYVSDPNDPTQITIQAFDPTGAPLQTITQGLSSPWALSVDSADRLFVTDTGNNRIAVYSPYTISTDPNSLAPQTVTIGTPSQPLGGWNLPNGPNPAGPIGQLQEPTSIAFDHLGRLLVADTDNCRLQIFDMAHLLVNTVAVPQTIASTATTMQVLVSVSMPPTATTAVSNVVPTIPSVSFGQLGTAVVNTTPSCIVTPTSNNTCVSSLTGLTLNPGQSLTYTFTFPVITGAVGPAWFTVGANGIDSTNSPVVAASEETYAVAIAGDQFGAPTITESTVDPSGHGASSTGWYGSQPIDVVLNATVPNPGLNGDPSTNDGQVEEIQYAIGPAAPAEGQYYSCYNFFASGTPATCTIPIYQEGLSTIWYRALSTRGLYDHSTTTTFSGSSVSVPGWSSVNVDIDLTPPVLNYGGLPSHNGWYNSLPASIPFTVSDPESGIASVTLTPQNGVSASTSGTTGSASMTGTLNFSIEGRLSATLTASDLAGNTHDWVAHANIDVTAPTFGAAQAPVSSTALVAANGATWSRSPITVSWTATDNLSGFDSAGTLSTACTSTVTTGRNQLVTCGLSDYAGNAATSAQAGPFSIDTTAPQVTFTTSPAAIQGANNSLWYQASPSTATFTGNDTVGGVAGVGFAAGQTATTIVNVSGNQATATLTDLVGNTTTSTAGPFQIDAVPPTVTFTLSPANATVGTTPWYRIGPSVTFTANDNGGSGFKDPTTGAFSQIATAAVASTGQAVSQSFTDLVGNTATQSAGPFNVDSTPPAITWATLFLDNTPAVGVVSNGTTWFGAPIDVKFTATDAGVGFSAAAPTPTQTQGSTISSGSQTVSQTFTDLLGNAATASAGPFAIDTTAPQVTFTTTPLGVVAGGFTWYQTPPATVTFTASDTVNNIAGSGFATGQTASATVSVAGNQASYTFTDLVGNATTTTAGPFRIFAVAPTVTYTTPAPGATVGTTPWYGASVPVTFTANDNGGPGFLDAGQFAPTATATVTSTGASVSQSFTDAVGNTGSASAGPFNIDSAPPVVTYAITYVGGSTATGAPVGGTTWFNAPVDVKFTATDAGVGFSSTEPTLVQTADVVVSTGAQAVSHSFSDLLLHATTSSAGTLGVDTAAPVLTVPQPITVTASPTSAVVNFSVTATDNVAPSPVVTCTPASGSTFPYGATKVTCTSTDEVGNLGTGTFTVNVVDKTPPVLTLPQSPMRVLANAPTVVNYTVTATDNIDGTVAPSCSPASGTVFPVGYTTVTCTATDKSGNTSAPATFQVLVAATPPTITVPATITVVASGPMGTELSYTASATDVIDGPIPVVCAPPSGSTFPIGATTVSCTATDSVGLSATKTFQVIVLHSVPVCTGAVATTPLWPPNHRLVPITISGITNPDGMPVALTVTSIFQDEPTNGLGDGDTPIDGFGVGTSQPIVRAERSGNLNGRVYHIRFNAATTYGDTCSGDVGVGVPHDMAHPAVDDGPIYNSTVVTTPDKHDNNDHGR